MSRALMMHSRGQHGRGSSKGGAPKYVRHWADVEAGQARVAGQVIEHGYASLQLVASACCMILSGVSSMGSNVLKNTRDTSL